MRKPVAIFWDYENCRPPASTSGNTLIEKIRRIVQSYGEITNFKAYTDISLECCGGNSTKVTQLLSEFQSSGLSLIHCPHNGKKDVVDKMMLVDMVSYAIDHKPPATIVVISGDRDFCYGISILKNRGYDVIIIAPTPNAHPHLVTQGIEYIRFQDLLHKEIAKETTSTTVSECSELAALANSGFINASAQPVFETHTATVIRPRDTSISLSSSVSSDMISFDSSGENVVSGSIIIGQNTNRPGLQPITFSTSAYDGGDDENCDVLQAPSDSANIVNSIQTTNLANSSSSISYQTVFLGTSTNATLEDSEADTFTAVDDLVYSPDLSFSRPSTALSDYQSFMTPSASIADDDEFVYSAVNCEVDSVRIVNYNDNNQDHGVENEQGATMPLTTSSNISNISTQNLQQFMEESACRPMNDFIDRLDLNLSEGISSTTVLTEDNSGINNDCPPLDECMGNPAGSASTLKSVPKEDFEPIIHVLKKSQTKGVTKLRRSQLAELLDFRRLSKWPKLANSGVTFKEYIEKAEIAGIISVEGNEKDINLHWIRLQIDNTSQEHVVAEVNINPNSIDVAIGSNTQAAATVDIDPIFVPLVTSVRDLQLGGGTIKRVLRSRLGEKLITSFPNVYREAKVSGFFKYLKRAAEAGVVVLGSEGMGKEWVKLVEF